MTCDYRPAAVSADVRAQGVQERRDRAIGAALERAGWERAIYVCRAFRAWGRK